MELLRSQQLHSQDRRQQTEHYKYKVFRHRRIFLQVLTNQTKSKYASKISVVFLRPLDGGKTEKVHVYIRDPKYFFVDTPPIIHANVIINSKSPTRVGKEIALPSSLYFFVVRLSVHRPPGLLQPQEPQREGHHGLAGRE